MLDNDYDYEMKATHPLNPTLFDSKWRVKLYKLNFSGQWDDMGTGYVSIIKEVKIFLFIKNNFFRMKIILSKCFQKQTTIKSLN